MSRTLITDSDIVAAINGRPDKRSYLCTWKNGVQKHIWADTVNEARRIAVEWAVRFELSPPQHANPMFITWDKEV